MKSVRLLNILMTTCIVMLPFYATWAQDVQDASSRAITGVVTDQQTGEPLVGVTVMLSGTSTGTVTNSLGTFSLKVPAGTTSLQFRYVGYESVTVSNLDGKLQIVLEERPGALDQVIVSANRERELRAEVPAAISTISAKEFEETAPNTLDQVLNKVPGVFVADLNNEQHMTAIRQPITSKGVFLYLEDGLPTRPTGVFNHNAMNEYNQGAIRNIEIIRGPASSTYGAEAIGGVINVITHAPTATPTARVALRHNSNGMDRADFRASNTLGKTGVMMAGYYTRRRNGYIGHSDMDKYAGTLKLTHMVSDKTDLNFTLTYVNMDTDMTGTLDSASFYGGDVTSVQRFTNRTVEATRSQLTLNHDWNEHGSTKARVFYRDDAVGQIPSYRIGTNSTTGVSYGRINERSYHSYGTILQHTQHLEKIRTKVIGGVSLDYSPTSYFENYILVNKSDEGIYTSYEETDSVMTRNTIDLTNLGTYATVQATPVDRLNVSASLRYDRFQYDHHNYLTPSSYSGSPSAVSTFQAVTPKIGATYDFSQNRGVYANYAQGFVPPQVSELYEGTTVPSLDPSVYNNYEVGGWFAFTLLEKLQVNTNLAFYRLDATNQIISVEVSDGTYENRNAGETRSRGIEYGVNVSYTRQWQFRWSGSFAKHEYTDYVEDGVSYNGKDMPQGPHVLYNWEITYRPSFVNGLRMGLENQFMGKYYMNAANTKMYDGYSIFHLRAGYAIKKFDISCSVLNLTDDLWSPRASASAYSVAYTLGIPRTYQFGVSYRFAKD